MAGSSTDEGAGGEFSLFLPAFSMQTAYRAVTQFGGLDQLVDRSLRMREVPGSKPGFSILEEPSGRGWGVAVAAGAPRRAAAASWQVALAAAKFAGLWILDSTLVS